MSTNINLKNSTDTTFSITHSDGANTKVLDSKDIAVAIDTVADFPANPNNGDVVIVRDISRGGTFIYDSSEVTNSNDGTNFDGWIRQYSGAVNVKWFGAKGDGVTDDTVALQNAIDNYKDIYIPTGIFLVSNTVYINNNGTTICGDSIFSIVKAKITDNINIFSIFKINGDSTRKYFITIKNIAIYGIISGEKHQTGLHLSNSAYCNFENINISGCYVGIDGYSIYNMNFNIVQLSTGYLGVRANPLDVHSLSSSCTSLNFTQCGITDFVFGIDLETTIYSSFSGFLQTIKKSNTLCPSNITPICMYLKGNSDFTFNGGIEDIDGMFYYNTGASQIKISGYTVFNTQFIADNTRIANVPFASQALFNVGSSSTCIFDKFSIDAGSIGITSSTVAIIANTNSLVTISGGYFYVGSKYIFKSGSGEISVNNSRFAPTIQSTPIVISTSTTTTEGKLIWATPIKNNTNGLVTVNTSNGRVTVLQDVFAKITINVNVELSSIVSDNTYMQVYFYDAGGSGATLPSLIMPTIGGSYCFYFTLEKSKYYEINTYINGTNGISLINSAGNKPTLIIEPM